MRVRGITIVVSVICAFIAVPDYAKATFCNTRTYWGLSWSGDSRYLLFHTYRSGDGVRLEDKDENRASYLCLLDTQTNSIIPCGDACRMVHQDPKTGQLFIFSDIGMLTASGIGAAWQPGIPGLLQVYVRPYDVVYHLKQGSLSYRSWHNYDHFIYVVSSLNGSRLGETRFCGEHGFEECLSDEWSVIFEGHDNHLYRYNNFTGSKEPLVHEGTIKSAQLAGNRILMIGPDGYQVYKGRGQFGKIKLADSSGSWRAIKRILRVFGPGEGSLDSKMDIRPPGSPLWIWGTDGTEDWLIPIDLNQITLLNNGRGLLGVGSHGLTLYVIGRPEPVILDPKAHDIRWVDKSFVVCAISSKSEQKSEWRVPIPEYVASATNEVFALEEGPKPALPKSDSGSLNEPPLPIRQYLLQGKSYHEEISPALVESATRFSATETVQLIEYSGGARLERRGRHVLLVSRKGDETEIIKPVDNRPDARVVESVISPNGDYVALLIDQWHSSGTPHFTGIIVIYNLDTGTEKSRLDSIFDCDESYGA